MLTAPKPLPDAPEVPAESVRWVYHAGYYDGPTSGMAVVNGERLWAELWDENDYPPYETDDEGFDLPRPWRRRFELRRLPPDVQAAEDERHACWRQHVGTHCDYEYDTDGKRRRSLGSPPLHPEANWRTYYDRYPPGTAGELTEGVGELVGWYEA